MLQYIILYVFRIVHHGKNLIFILLLYKGELTPAQALDKVTTQDYVLIDVRSDKDKAKAGVPQLPSSAKNKLISVPYAVISSLDTSSLRMC